MTTRSATLLMAVLAAGSTAVFAQSGRQAQGAAPEKEKTSARAHADIKGPGVTGTAELEEIRAGHLAEVRVRVTVKGLKPGRHGVHLHATGKCEPDFTAAGGHFDPGPFGQTDPDTNHPFHMGDLPNLEAGADGSGTLESVTTRVTLSEGPLSIFDADGTAIIVHGNPDQGITGEAKSGVSGGPRVACGVLAKR